MEVRAFSKDEWRKVSKEIHRYAFNEIIDDDLETISLALMAMKDETPQAYCTLIDMDKYTCYMQHGGALPAAKGTINVAKGYVKMVEWVKNKYPRITTRIRNDNVSMIKLALGVGFKIVGVEVYEDGVFLSLVNNSESKVC
jgi:hypothetical protein